MSQLMRCSGWGTESRPGIPRPTQALVVRSKAQRGVHQDTPDLPLDWENGYIESFNARLRTWKSITIKDIMLGRSVLQSA